MIDIDGKEIETGSISDGYHTFDELYEHRNLLFLAFLKMVRYPLMRTWVSTLHSDGTSFGDWFIAGVTIPNVGQISYHMPARFWPWACEIGAEVLERAPEWDGHTSADVIKRLGDWIAR